MAKSRKDSKGRALRQGESERKDGRYVYRYSDNGGGCVYANTLEKLREKEKQIQRDMLDGINTKLAAHNTLNDLFDMSISAKSLRDSTKHNYIMMWDSNIRLSLGKMKVADITPYNIRRLYAEFESRGLARNTIKLLHVMICSALDIAVEGDMIRKNPAKSVKFGGEVAEKKPLSRQEQESLLNFLNGENIYNIYKPMITIMIGTGLRVSELCGLTWEDIDFKENIIKVNKQLLKHKTAAEQGKSLYIEKTKTESGKRTIPMTEAVRKAFKDQMSLMMMLGRRGFAEVDGYTDFIFITKNNTPFCVTNVNFVLSNIIKAHNKVNEIQLPHFSAHILRHTAATRMAEAGIEPKSLQKILGHSKIDITFDVYVDVDEEHIKSEMQKTESIIKFA